MSGETGVVPSPARPAGFAGGRRPRPPLAEALAHPAEFYASPREVACDPDLWPDEKRALLLSWARDALAIEQLAKGGLPAEIAAESRADAVIDALAAGEYRAALETIRGERRRAFRRRAG
ncbi:hypothetical protein [Enterovirga aerilata]|uniref:Uncharacterized protein n=1 Tax=Enterovirga aerilata TaxID=2730920 RepID=A0A849I2C3_9HYPH|nr:hypothetical protein [Enterovirga sp. DB1703]NNM71498.1 hypothetical protein [Enterovirga sp. DB1703]